MPVNFMILPLTLNVSHLTELMIAVISLEVYKIL